MSQVLDSLFGLRGRSALVTGSSRGIGAAIACGLSGAGARIVLHARTRQACQPVHDDIASAGGQVWSLAGDLSERDAGRTLAEEAERLTGGLDILVINASAQINARLEGIEPVDFERQIAVILKSTVDMLQSCLPKMAARGWGRIVSIGSINQLRPKSLVTAYAATKAAQHNLIQSLARDYAGQGVLLNTLAPGLVDTDRNRGRKQADPEAWEAYVRSVNLMGRMGRPEEIVGAAVFLASDACSFMTGETVFVTGGS